MSVIPRSAYRASIDEQIKALLNERARHEHPGMTYTVARKRYDAARWDEYLQADDSFGPEATADWTRDRGAVRRIDRVRSALDDGYAYVVMERV